MKPLLASFALVLLAACGSSPSASATKPVSVVPRWEAVPPSVLEAVCARLRGEGLGRQEAIRVVGLTQPLIMRDSVQALAEATGRAKVNRKALEELVPGPMPITLSAGSGCHFVTIERYEPRRDADRMVLQLSSPFANPFAKGEAGLFARLTVGDQAAQWYWVPLLVRGDQTVVGAVMPLAMHEG